jgi:hypothetical protein
MIMASPLTDEERMTLKTAAFGAVFLVSNADPGVFSMIRESFAASGAIAGTTGLVREVLTTGRLPKLPSDSPADVPAVVLPALGRAVEILRAKVPDELENYRGAVLTTIDVVARAVNGIDPAEAAMISEVRRALDLPA